MIALSTSGDCGRGMAKASMIAQIIKFYGRWRHLTLLVTLLLVLVVQPITFGFSTPTPLFDALLILVTIALVLSFCDDKNKRLVAIAFGIPTGLFTLGGRLLAA